MTPRTRKRIIKCWWILILAPFALLFAALLTVWMFAKIPSFEELEHPDSKEATQILADGGEVLTTFHIENRTFVPYDEISPNVVHAAVATEDVRFYRHSGIDFRGLARVLVKTLAFSNSSQGGGSTITQQLAKTLYPRKETSSRLLAKANLVWTKFKEWITAIKLETNYTKDEIMGMYLNSIFFGSGAYGIYTASQTFFSKEPSDLTVEEAATLVGMVNKPTRYNPVLNPEQSLGRRNFVIGQMCKAGFITNEERDSLVQVPIKLDYHVLDHNSGLAPYFRDMLRREMSAEKPRRADYQYREEYSADSLRWVEDGFYGWLNKNRKADGSRYDIDKDGLRIHTTINYRMQTYAEQAVSRHLGKTLQKDFWRDLSHKLNPPFSNDVPQEVREAVMKQSRRWSDRWRVMRSDGASDKEILASFKVPVKMRVFSWNSRGYIDTVMSPDDSILYYKSILRAGLMAIEPNTGHVKAYVGGPNYRYFKYDNVSQGKRQVGSTVKPFLYSLALTQGMTPCDEVANVPQTFELPTGETWTPQGEPGGVLSLKMALATSNNNISAFLMRQYGPEALADHMHRMGINTHIDPVYSLCVGSADVSVKDMVCAYNTFPSKGVYSTPLFVTSIEDAHGNVLSEFTGRKQEVLGLKETCQMIDMMAAVVNHGTGIRLRPRYGVGGDICGKTGTTNDNSDGWFIGYTPTVCAGVWVGGESRQVHFESTALGQGANAALPIWGYFIKMCQDDPSVPINASDRFVIPGSVSIDSDCSEGGYYFSGDTGITTEGPEGRPGEDGDEYDESQAGNEAHYFN